MSFYPITSFWYDSTTNNVVLQFAVDKPDDVPYEYGPDELPYEIYEAEIFLDANQVLIGKSYPSSLDGTITGEQFGRMLGQDRNVVPNHPLENAEPPTD